jgi:sugar lactone lactonase YvrE
MKKLLALFILVAANGAIAQTYETNITVETFAGSGFYGYLDGVGALTMFYGPAALAADSHSNLFVADTTNVRIRKIAPDSTVTTFAGGGNQIPGEGTNALLTMGSLAMGLNDTIWMIGPGYSYSGPQAALYEITPNAIVTRDDFSITPSGICIDPSGIIYLSDSSANKIYRYNTNQLFELFAGSGNPGDVDGNGVFTSFNSPTAMSCDAAGNIYVFDSASRVLRKITPGRDVTTVAGNPALYYYGPDMDGAGTNAVFTTVSSMCMDNLGNLILACGSSVRKLSLSTSNVTTLAGSFTQTGYANGPGNLALFKGPAGVCFIKGTLYVSDSSNERIRTITSSQSAQPVSPANLLIGTYAGLQLIGTIGRSYRIESSTDLQTWTPETTFILTTSPYFWVDQKAMGAKKFYRSFLLP